MPSRPPIGNGAVDFGLHLNRVYNESNYIWPGMMSRRPVHHWSRLVLSVSRVPRTGDPRSRIRKRGTATGRSQSRLRWAPRMGRWIPHRP